MNQMKKYQMVQIQKKDADNLNNDDLSHTSQINTRGWLRIISTQ